MNSNSKIYRTALAAALSLTLFAGCGDPGGTPGADGADVSEAGSLVRTLDLTYGGRSLVDFDGAEDGYVVDVSILGTEVTLRAVAV